MKLHIDWITISLLFFCGCAPAPSRPADLGGVHMHGYEACERQHSSCLTGGRIQDGSSEAPGTEAVFEGTYLDSTYGFASSCNQALQRCYDRERMQSAPSATPIPNP